MKTLSLTLQQIAEFLGGELTGDGSAVITGLSSIDAAGPGELTFADEKHANQLASSKAGGALVVKAPASAPMPLIRVANLQGAVFALLTRIGELEDFPQGVHPTATVSP